MTPQEIELEKFKMQKTQLHLQVASVIISAILLYTLVSGRGKIQEVENDFPSGE